MAIVDLALQGQNNIPRRLSAIAASQDIDLSYLEQIFNALKNAKLVKSYRGPNGGYELVGAPEDIRIIDVIRAVNEPLEMTRCKTEKSCLGKQHNARCKTHALWSGLTKHIEDYLGAQTVANIVNTKQHEMENLKKLEA